MLADADWLAEASADALAEDDPLAEADWLTAATADLLADVDPLALVVADWIVERLADWLLETIRLGVFPGVLVPLK